jgi:uncharacterized protein YkuJ
MLGDSWVYEKTLLPKKITETKAITRFSNIKDADVLAEKLKKNGALMLSAKFTNESLSFNVFSTEVYETSAFLLIFLISSSFFKSLNALYCRDTFPLKLLIPI